MTSFHDVMIVCSDVPVGKPLTHVHQKCHHLSVHLLAFMPESHLMKLHLNLSVFSLTQFPFL